MAQVTGYTATRMKAIEDSAIVDGDVVGDDLILKRFDGQLINAGSVRGPTGLTGPTGPVPEAPLNTTPYIRKNGLWVPGTEAPIRDTLANLNANNPVVAAGRIAVATDSNPRRFAIGNDVDTWSNLVKYYAGGAGVLGYGQVIADQNGVGTTITDLTGLAVTVTVAASRRIRVSGQALILLNSGAIAAYGTIAEGAVELQRFAQIFTSSGVGAGSINLTPSAGAHTYKLRLQASAGTVSMLATNTYPAFISVEDVGGV